VEAMLAVVIITVASCGVSLFLPFAFAFHFHHSLGTVFSLK